MKHRGGVRLSSIEVPLERAVYIGKGWRRRVTLWAPTLEEVARHGSAIDQLTAMCAGLKPEDLAALSSGDRASLRQAMVTLITSTCQRSRETLRSRHA